MKTRFLPPRSSPDDGRGAANGARYAWLVVLVLVPVVAMVLAWRITVGAGEPLTDPTLFGVGLVGIGAFFIALTLWTQRPGSRFEDHVSRLEVGALGASGSVAAFVGEVQPGPAGTIVAPVSGRPCVWALVSRGTSSDAVPGRLRQEWREAATTFRVVDAAGTTVEVDPTDGHLLFVTREGEPTRDALDAFGRGLGLPPGPGENVRVEERVLLPGKSVLVVGVVHRAPQTGSAVSAYRADGGEHPPRLAGDATTGLMVANGGAYQIWTVMRRKQGVRVGLAFGGWILSVGIALLYLSRL